MIDATIGFIGAGNIAMAMVRGLLAQDKDPARVAVADPVASQLQPFADLGVTTGEDNRALAQSADLVILAVKPDRIVTVASEIAPVLRPDAAVISVAAGMTLATLEACLGDQRAIIRCMPNTPALVQCGATGAFANPRVSEAQRQAADGLLGGMGLVRWVSREADIDTVTAVSGSGPAYFFRIMEIMEGVAVDLGLPSDIARALVAQTLAGAARMVQETGEDPAELRRKVTSRGGTTQAALERFEAGGLAELVEAAMRAAHARSIELAARD